MTIAIVENQNLVDFALQKYGVAESIIQLCNDNGISLSDDLVSGAQVLIDETIVYKTTGAITGPAAAAINRKRLVNEYESAVDIALKECNSVEALIDVLIGNGIAPDDDLTAGEQLLIKPEWKRKRLPAPAMIIPSKKKVMNEYDNIVDAALAIYGNAESLVGICSLNALLVDEEINPGQLLIDNTQEYKTTGAILGPLKSTLKTTEMVIEHQNLIDAVLQYYGSVEQLVTLCEENLLDVNTSLQASMMISLNSDNMQHKTLTRYLDKKGININTGEVPDVNDGIDYMIIEDTFIVR